MSVESNSNIKVYLEWKFQAEYKYCVYFEAVKVVLIRWLAGTVI